MESLAQFSTYVVTLTLAAILPGPGMIGIMFKTLTQGHKSGAIMLLGLITGDVFYLLTSIFFISLLTIYLPDFLLYLVIVSSTYLLFLAYQFWSFTGNLLKTDVQNTRNQNLFSYKDGLLLTLSNPKNLSRMFFIQNKD